MRVRESKGTEAFATLYGTNTNKKNAYGKCVSKIANAKANAREDAEDGAAAAACKKQKAEDAAKFAKTYKNLGQCVKAAKKSSGYFFDRTRLSGHVNQRTVIAIARRPGPSVRMAGWRRRAGCRSGTRSSVGRR